MNKIFPYELRRLLGGKFFLGLPAISLLYAWQLLSRSVILGVADTAPFSPWSFGCYLGGLQPLLGLTLLFLLWEQGREQARSMELLASATPTSPGRYRLTKALAAAAAWLLLALGLCLLGLGFLSRLFGDAVQALALLWPALVLLLPALAFLLGGGLWLARRRPALAAIPLALALLVSYLPLPLCLDLCGSRLFSQYPLTLGQPDPAFSLPPAAWVMRGVYLTLGCSCFFLAVRHKRNHS